MPISGTTSVPVTARLADAVAAFGDGRIRSDDGADADAGPVHPMDQHQGAATDSRSDGPVSAWAVERSWLSVVDRISTAGSVLTVAP